MSKHSTALTRSTRNRSRRLDRLNRSVDIVLQAMRDGATLQLQFHQTGSKWRMSNGHYVTTKLPVIVIDKRVAGVGDTLFADGLSQTWRFVEALKTGNQQGGHVNDNQADIAAHRATQRRSNNSATAATPDPFAPENLRLSQSFNEMVGVKKILTTVPVRKPGAQDFVRVRPGPEYRENFPIIDLKDDREEFVVTAALVPELLTELVNKTLYLAINKQGTVFFWPVRLPTPDGKDLDWWRSGREAADRATRTWVRVQGEHEPGRVRNFRSGCHV